MLGVAGFGHVVVALASARLRSEEGLRPRAWRQVAAYVALAMLPDADVLPSLFVTLKGPLSSHRGLTHTPLFAVLVGAVVGLLCHLCSRRAPARALRAGLIATLLVGSHGLLDAMAQGGRGILFLWPLSLARFHCIWRPIPDIPAGLALLTRDGLRQLGLELLLFFPAAAYALRRRVLWRSAPRPDARPTPYKLRAGI